MPPKPKNSTSKLTREELERALEEARNDKAREEEKNRQLRKKLQSQKKKEKSAPQPKTLIPKPKGRPGCNSSDRNGYELYEAMHLDKGNPEDEAKVSTLRQYVRQAAPLNKYSKYSSIPNTHLGAMCMKARSDPRFEWLEDYEGYWPVESLLEIYYKSRTDYERTKERKLAAKLKKAKSTPAVEENAPDDDDLAVDPDTGGGDALSDEQEATNDAEEDGMDLDEDEEDDSGAAGQGEDDSERPLVIDDDEESDIEDPSPRAKQFPNSVKRTIRVVDSDDEQDVPAPPSKRARKEATPQPPSTRQASTAPSTSGTSKAADSRAPSKAPSSHPLPTPTQPSKKSTSSTKEKATQGASSSAGKKAATGAGQSNGKGSKGNAAQPTQSQNQSSRHSARLANAKKP